MISWIWLIVVGLVMFLLGFVIVCIADAKIQADKYHEGYRQAVKDMFGAKEKGKDKQ